MAQITYSHHRIVVVVVGGVGGIHVNMPVSYLSSGCRPGYPHSYEAAVAAVVVAAAVVVVVVAVTTAAAVTAVAAAGRTGR